MDSFVLAMGVCIIGLALFMFACTLFLYLATNHDKILYCYGCEKIIKRHERIAKKRDKR